jgi:transcriptional regulator with XRE-family HTH domain
MLPPQERFADRLRAAMQEKYGPRARAAQLARDTGLSEQTISRWLNAKVTPTPALLAQLSPTLPVPLAEWLATAGIVEDHHHTAPANYPEWADWLRAALATADLTPEQFADRADLESRTVERWLTGASAPHSADLAIDVAHMLAGDTIAAVAAAGHPKTAALLQERELALADHPIIARIQSDPDLTRREKENLIAEVARRQREEFKIFEQRVADAVRARRHAGRRAPRADDDQAAG